MVQVFTVVMAGLYCFTWLRIPEDVFDVVLPVQRMLSWAGLIAVILSIAFQSDLRLSKPAKVFLITTTAFLIYICFDLGLRWVISSGDFFNEYFELKLFIYDFSKYLASFSSTFIIYYALQRSPGLARVLIRALILSGSLSIMLAYLFLLFFVFGFSTEQEFLAPSFGGYLGVWDVGGALPRLAGTTPEPNAFSTIFLAPLFLMLSKRYFTRFWPIALAGVIALILSQSKFALVSLTLVTLYFWLIHKQYRTLIAVIAVIILPPAVYFLSTLPTFSQTLESGFDSGSFVERAKNVGLLFYIIAGNFFNGIGAGQYANYVNHLLGFQYLSEQYYPNQDYLKIFAETGFFGFSMIAFLLLRFAYLFISGYKSVASEQQDCYLAFLFAVLAFTINMFFSYEFLHTPLWICIGFLMFMLNPQPSECEENEESIPLAAVGSSLEKQ